MTCDYCEHADGCPNCRPHATQPSNVRSISEWTRRTAWQMVTTHDTGRARLDAELAKCRLAVRRATLEELLLIEIRDLQNTTTTGKVVG